MLRAAFLDAGRRLATLLADDRVAAAWSVASALDGMTVGALAGHLVRALDTVELYLDEPEPPADAELIGPDEYYRRALASLTPEANAGIRQRGADAAAAGHAALLADHEGLVERLTVRLGDESPGRRVTVMRGAAHMTLDDYLPTRLVEIVVHADDLAVSVGAPAPAFDDVVWSTVVDVLVRTARITHGDLAVVRALARRERDVLDALRVL